MTNNKSKIYFYKIKRFLFLMALVSILFFVYWDVVKKVSPVFKPPQKDRPPIQRDHRGVLNIKAIVDYKNTRDVKKEAANSTSESSLSKKQ